MEELNYREVCALIELYNRNKLLFNQECPTKGKHAERAIKKLSKLKAEYEDPRFKLVKIPRECNTQPDTLKA